MRKQLIYVAPRRVGVVMGTIHGLLGLILLPFILLKRVFTSATGGSEKILTGSIFILFTPLGYAAFGFVCGILGAVIYNVIAKRIGGIEFDLRDLPPDGHLQPPLSAAEDSLDIQTLIIGNWLGKAANNFVGVYTFYADGNAQCEASNSSGSNRVSGHWEVEGDSIWVKWDNGDTDIIKLTNPKHYRWTNPQSPDAGGMATRQ